MENTASLNKFPDAESTVHKLDIRKRPNCYRCNGQHPSDECVFKDKTCFACNKQGHISRVCKSKKTNENSGKKYHERKADKSFPTKQLDSGSDQVQTENEVPVSNLYNLYRCEAVSNPEIRNGNGGGVGMNIKRDREEFPMHCCAVKRVNPMFVNVKLNGKPVRLELDTGASLTVMGENSFRKEVGEMKLKSTNLKLKTYSGEFILPRGVAEVEVQHGGKVEKLPVVVMPGETPSLLGRNWLERLNVD